MYTTATTTTTTTTTAAAAAAAAAAATTTTNATVTSATATNTALCPFNILWWRSGESTRLPPMWPGFDSQTWRHIWVEFVGYLLWPETGYSSFPLSSKSYV